MQSTNTIGQGIQKFLLKNPFLCIAQCMLKVPAKMSVIREASCVTNDKASTPKSRSSRIHLTVFAVSAESAKSSRSSNLLAGTSPTCKTIGIRHSLFSCRVHPDQCHIIAWWCRSSHVLKTDLQALEPWLMKPSCPKGWVDPAFSLHHEESH